MLCTSFLILTLCWWASLLRGLHGGNQTRGKRTATTELVIVNIHTPRTRTKVIESSIESKYFSRKGLKLSPQPYIKMHFRLIRLPSTCNGGIAAHVLCGNGAQRSTLHSPRQLRQLKRLWPYRETTAKPFWWASIRAKQLSIAATALVTCLCACVRYWWVGVRVSLGF